ncbi:hypothetical protein GMLC_03070 [Geomonas limicola]|uniref:Lipocalin-like domain-containing protein n=1 Tax=Geomonas limicola TaxID=2740186 RepID=A0A6V8N2G9_9BACT|nr:hypothetical protein [Geomonas limicola]GFO66728.1 hypothetical protein GMLC_03070 [Geomonas limicola]
MLKNVVTACLAVTMLLSLFLVPQALASESAAGNLLGSWSITHRPVNGAGKPCPFIPEGIEFFKDQTLVMSNMPGRHFPFKFELSAEERKAIESRSAEFQGKQLLLVKPVPNMPWEKTPMAYAYSVTANELTLEVLGWEPATFKRSK